MARLSFSFFNRYWRALKRTTGERPKLSLFLFLFLIFLFISVGPNVPGEKVVPIHMGTNLGQAGEDLKEAGVIRSPLLFKIFGKVFSSHVVAGSYRFSGRENIISVFIRLHRGSFGVAAVKIQIREGLHREQIAHLLASRLGEFDAKEFMTLTEGKEGYLFPDTYYFPPTTNAEEAATILSESFNEKTRSLRQASEAAGLSFHELVTMASLVEREAAIEKDKKLVAGILWKRIKLKIPLQVDAVFVYLLGRGSADLSLRDLALKSPYNTYVNLGLPPGPIANPGLESLEASLYYEDSPYLFYLSDSKNVIHYSVTFEEHVENKRKYIY